MTEVLPRMFGRYRLEERFGGAGMSAVYRATNTTHADRPCVIKQLPQHLADDPEFRARFLDEVSTIGKLRSPSIVSTFDSGELDGVLFLAMELVEGADLRSMIAYGPLRVVDTVEIVREIADALETAHRHGVVHRDVKPGNILVRPRWAPEAPLRALLLDFGIARLDGAPRGHTKVGEAVGTLAYMAPERFKARSGAHADPGPGTAVDVYGLACVIYECLTGRLAFDRPEEVIAAAHADREHRPRPGEWDPALARFDELVERGLAVDPGRRPSPSQLAAWLAAAATNPPLPAQRPGGGDTALVRVPRASRFERVLDGIASRTTIVGLGAATAVAVGGAAIGTGVVADAVAAAAAFGAGAIGTWLLGPGGRTSGEGSPPPAAILPGEKQPAGPEEQPGA